MVDLAAPTRRARATPAPLRELSGRVAAAAARMRPHVAAVYAFARAADDFADEGSGRSKSVIALLDGWLLPTAVAAGHASRPAAAGEPANTPEIFVALGARSRALDCRRAVRGSAQRVPAGRHGHALRDLGRRARLLPPIGQPGRPARAPHRRLPRRASSTLVRRDLHGAAAHELLAGPEDRLRPRAPLSSRRRAARHGARPPTLDARRITPAWARRWPPPSADARAVRRWAGRSATPCAAGCATSCARPGSAARASSIGSKRPDFDVIRTDRPSLGPLGRAMVCAWRCSRVDPAGRRPVEGRKPDMSRDTSFYYSFLVLPPRSATPSSRCGISAAPSTMRSTKWCRARVGGADRRRARAAALAACGARSWTPRYRRNAARRRRASAAAVRPRFNLPRAAVRGADRRRRDGSLARALRDVRRAARVLPARRLGRRPDLHRDLRLPRRRVRATTPRTSGWRCS